MKTELITEKLAAVVEEPRKLPSDYSVYAYKVVKNAIDELLSENENLASGAYRYIFLGRQNGHPFSFEDICFNFDIDLQAARSCLREKIGRRKLRRMAKRYGK